MSTITSATSSTYIASAPTVQQSGAFAEQAAALSTDSSVIASIGSTSSSITPLYTAQGLMNSLVQAATSSNTSTDTSTSSTSTGTTTDSTDSSTTSTTFDGSPNWASVLKSNPNLTSTYLTDESNQLILNSFSAYA